MTVLVRLISPPSHVAEHGRQLLQSLMTQSMTVVVGDIDVGVSDGISVGESVGTVVVASVVGEDEGTGVAAELGEDEGEVSFPTSACPESMAA